MKETFELRFSAYSTMTPLDLQKFIGFKNDTPAGLFDYNKLTNVKMWSPLRVTELRRFYIRGLDTVRAHVDGHSFASLMLSVPNTFRDLKEISILLADSMHSFVFERYGRPKAGALKFFSKLTPYYKFTLRFEVEVN